MDNKNLLYCGLGIYTNPLTGDVFKKTASGDLRKIEDEKIKAEIRFMKRHADDGTDEKYKEV